MKSKKAQIWSMDIIIAVTLFLIAFIAIILILNRTTTKVSVDTLIEDNEDISDVLVNEDRDLALSEGRALNYDAIRLFEDKSYDDIKKELGLEADFCIHFKNEQNQIVNVFDTNIIGDPDAYIIMEDLDSGERVKFSCDGRIIN